MTKISTDVCKQFLSSIFTNTSEKEWKRTKKFKNEQGLWIRDFEHSHEGTISLIEADGVLSLHSERTQIQTPQPKSSGATFEKRTFNSEDIKTAITMLKTEHEKGGYSADHLKHLNKIPNSINGFNAIPGVLLWCIPIDMCENSDFDMKSMSLSSNMNGTTLLFFDTKYEYENPLDFVKKKVLPKYLDDLGDSLFEVDADITLETIVRDLSLAGFTYKNVKMTGEDGCLIRKVMKNVAFIPVDDMALQQKTEHNLLKEQATAVSSAPTMHASIPPIN